MLIVINQFLLHFHLLDCVHNWFQQSLISEKNRSRYTYSTCKKLCHNYNFITQLQQLIILRVPIDSYKNYAFKKISPFDLRPKILLPSLKFLLSKKNNAKYKRCHVPANRLSIYRKLCIAQH